MLTAYSVCTEVCDPGADGVVDATSSVQRGVAPRATVPQEPTPIDVPDPPIEPPEPPDVPTPQPELVAPIPS